MPEKLAERMLGNVGGRYCGEFASPLQDRSSEKRARRASSQKCVKSLFLAISPGEGVLLLRTQREAPFKSCKSRPWPFGTRFFLGNRRAEMAWRRRFRTESITFLKNFSKRKTRRQKGRRSRQKRLIEVPTDLRHPLRNPREGAHFTEKKSQFQQLFLAIYERTRVNCFLLRLF